MTANSGVVDANDQAELHKQRGNRFYTAQRYDEAIREYTTAIIQNPQVVVYYTNRALCYQKLGSYTAMEQDCRRAIEIDKNAAKAHFLLGKALLGQSGCEARAVAILQKAYTLAVEQKLSFVPDILNVLRPARKQRWERDERARLERRSESFAYLSRLINDDYNRAINELPLLTDESIPLVERNQINEEMRNSLKQEFDDKLQQLDLLFAQVDVNMKKREIPEYFCDKISFEIMHDPVITPSGITYERNELLTHLKQIGPFDPLSRTPLREEDLKPNLALREAIEDFIKE
ncbi:STIP1 homology and U box-containing protein 1-like protein [Syncephalis plumigaleata]|nr:STIP1 homology and U box-containing protein 1-like protein [Syncephalis plumigaleata]